MKPDHFYLPEQNFDWTHTVYGHIQEIIPQHLYWHSHERLSLPIYYVDLGACGHISRRSSGVIHHGSSVLELQQRLPGDPCC